VIVVLIWPLALPAKVGCQEVFDANSFTMFKWQLPKIFSYIIYLLD
jgi:hypothetical protein